MFSRTSKVAVVAASVAAIATSASAQSTTRIETRPFYGATISIEAGVRVFRPLPPDDRVIINPHGQTPLSLGFNETRVYEHSVIENHLPEESRASSGGDYPRTYGGFGNFGRGFGPGAKFQRGGVGDGGGRSYAKPHYYKPHH
jgi:hypothetical protein